jgi:hypothetical protein
LGETKPLCFLIFRSAERAEPAATEDVEMDDKMARLLRKEDLDQGNVAVFPATENRLL